MAFFGGLADGVSDDLAVGHDDDDVGAEIGEGLGDLGDLFRLPDGDAVFEGEGLDFRGEKLTVTAADGFVRLGD